MTDQQQHRSNHVSFGIVCIMFGSILGYFLGTMNLHIGERNAATKTPSAQSQSHDSDSVDVDIGHPVGSPPEEDQSNVISEASFLHNGNINKNNNNLRTIDGTGTSDQRRLFGLVDPKSVESRFNQPLGREVHIGTMCRCPGQALPVPGEWSWDIRFHTDVVQPASIATGPMEKHFIMHPLGCTCLQNNKMAELSVDPSMNTLHRMCPDHPDQKYDWHTMPDFGVEERLPLFAGVLSYKSPLSLNATLHDWHHHRFFERVNAQDVFVQLNRMSEQDQQIIQTHNDLLREDASWRGPAFTPLGSDQDNLHPGLAIGKFCRAAENHPKSHPNGENLMLWLEKDWHMHDDCNGPKCKLAQLEEMFYSINGLMQRGVHYVRLTSPRPMTISGDIVNNDRTWKCPSQGFPWLCTMSHQHHWTNLPAVIDCKWFLRYLEPYALFDDPIMYGCRPGQARNKYCDWEHAMQDGRVAWTNSNWVVAHFAPPRMKLFDHFEVDK